MIAAARLPLRSEPAKSQFLRPSAHGRIWFSAQLLSMGTAPSSMVARQRCPAFQTVIQRSADSRTFGHEIALGDHPVMQHIYHRHVFFLPSPGVRIVVASPDLPQTRPWGRKESRCAVLFL